MYFMGIATWVYSVYREGYAKCLQERKEGGKRDHFKAFCEESAKLFCLGSVWLLGLLLLFVWFFFPEL